MTADFMTGIGVTTMIQYQVIGHPTTNGTSFIQVNSTINTYSSQPGFKNITIPFTGWFWLNGTADFFNSNGVITHCSSQDENYCKTYGPFPMINAVFAGGEFTSNATLMAHFKTAQKIVSIGPTQFTITNYTLSSSVAAFGTTLTNGYFEVGHPIGSNLNFLLVSRLYSGTQPYGVFEVVSATRA